MDTVNIILERRNIQDLTNAVVAHQPIAKQGLQVKEDVLTHYGGGRLACVKCGYSDVRALCLDHINGREPTEFGKPPPIGGIPLYRWLRREGYPEGYQTLCYKCNVVKCSVDYNWYK